ncbi:hypothetical protein CLAVI_000998 [Candidatus Clavichlamydia salmonicola]|uniref:hypothetical protein n=1 Tax=Candidatus Clavichlamydia salmonicola TaxID=469812 RepID=UPI001891E349|nr:hypothetical protein [Candidatus Clavichlamydia salmonicola]MBF5051355.1 hypothetical protein [Candidatus Clavichlamydia salmonicola]
MPYFTLNYIAPVLEEAAPYFTVADGPSNLTSSHVQSIHALTHRILSNHLICMSVPPSFPLDTTCHHNTVLILQEAVYPIIRALRTMPLITADQSILASLEKIFFNDLLQVDLTEFEQPLPIVTKDIVSSNLHITSPISYNLPFIEISPDGRSFTLTPYPVTDPLHYLEYLHQGVAYVFENNIFISDPLTAPLSSVRSLANHSLLSLLQLLLSQSRTISLITDTKERQDIAESNNNWLSRLTTELKLAGFSDANLAQIWEEPISHKEQPSNTAPKVNKTASTKKITPRPQNITWIPLFIILEDTSATKKKCLKDPPTYLCKYYIKKINPNSSVKYFDIKKSIITTCKIFIKIYTPNSKSNVLFNYIHPVSTKRTMLNTTEALALLFEGLSENFYFLSQHFSYILQNVHSNLPQSLLKKCLQIAKSQLGPNIPQVIPHILTDMLNNELLVHSRQATQLINTSKIDFLAIFSIRLFITGHKTAKTERIQCYMFQYTILKTPRRKSDSCTIARISIKNTEKHIQYLCSSEYQSSCLLKHINPFSKKVIIKPLNEVLLLTLHGLQENLYFLPLQFPTILNHTTLYQPQDSLNNCITLIKNKLGQNVPEESATNTPNILKTLFNNMISKEETILQKDA